MCGEKCCGSMWCPCGSHFGWVSVVLRIVLALIILAIVFLAGVKLGEFKSSFEGYSGRNHGIRMMGTQYYGGANGYYGGSGMMRNFAPSPTPATGTAPSAK